MNDIVAEVKSGTKVFVGKAAKQQSSILCPGNLCVWPGYLYVGMCSKSTPHTCHLPVTRFLGSSLVKLGGKSAQGVLLSFGCLGQATFACGCTTHWETESIQLGLLLKLAGKGLHPQQWAPSTLATIV